MQHRQLTLTLKKLSTNLIFNVQTLLQRKQVFSRVLMLSTRVTIRLFRSGLQTTSSWLMARVPSWRSPDTMNATTNSLRLSVFLSSKSSKAVKIRLKRRPSKVMGSALIPVFSTACRRTRRKRKWSNGSKVKGEVRDRFSTAYGTGSFRGNGIGANPFRSHTLKMEPLFNYQTKNYPSNCRLLMPTNRQKMGNRPLRVPDPSGWTWHYQMDEPRRGKRTSCHNGQALVGTISVSSTPTMLKHLLIPHLNNIGCPLTSTLVVQNTRYYTYSTPDFGIRFCMIVA